MDVPSAASGRRIGSIVPLGCSPRMGDFGADTAVHPRSDGTLECAISPDWWVLNGPNGGYVAAILVRALEAAAGADARPLRSLTVHYLRAPVERSGSLEVSVEREGRSVSFVQARLLQDGRVCAVAMAVLADGREGISLEHAAAPEVAPPEELPEPPPRPQVPPFAERFEYRSAFSGGGNAALAGGWLRLRRPHPLDAALLVALCDAWIPPIFTVTREPVRVPTLELTVHVRAGEPLPADWALARFVTQTARDGLLEESGEIWSRDGRLLAQSRQLALVL